MASGTIKIASWGIIHWFDGRRHTVHRFGSCRNSNWVVQFSALTGRNSSSEQLCYWIFPSKPVWCSPEIAGQPVHGAHIDVQHRAIHDPRYWSVWMIADRFWTIVLRMICRMPGKPPSRIFQQIQRIFHSPSDSPYYFYFGFSFFVFLKWSDGVVICGVVLYCNLLFLDWSHWWEKKRLLWFWLMVS